MTINHFRMDRRTLLRGVGVTMALPWLESIPVWGDLSPANDDSRPFPQRFGCIFMGCGIVPDHWWAKGQGSDMELSRSLKPLEPLKRKINVIDGLCNESTLKISGPHPSQTGNLLSGAPLLKGAVIGAGTSVDYVLAQHFADQTPTSNIILGCEQPITGYHQTNYSLIYSSYISWRDAISPIPLEIYPALAFDALFDNHGNARTKSILDRVGRDAADLSRRVSFSDRAKLDEYLTSVREVEQRVEQARLAGLNANARATKTSNQPEMKRPDNGLPADIREHMKIMCDIVALAFQTDKTRVATLLLCRDLSSLFYPFLGVRTSHHLASHDSESDEYERIVQFYVTQFAYLINRLESMPEGPGTVLDNSCLMFISSMFSGATHDSSKVPLVLAGALGGTLETGRTLNYANESIDRRRLCSLYLSIMNRMGLKQTHFGDANAPLQGL